MRYVHKGASGVYGILQYENTADINNPRSYPNDEEKKAAEHAKKYGYLSRILAKLPKENRFARKRLPTLNS
jgi:hypothetical protein